MGRPGLTCHRKFRRLAQALGSKMMALGALELLWAPAYEAGDDYVGTVDDIERLVEWTGDRGALTRALVEAGAPEGAGFIERVDASGQGEPCYRIHDLMDHAPEYVARRRARELERKRAKTCAHCGTTYHNSDPRSLHCSDACRQAKWRDRHDEAHVERCRDADDGSERTRSSRETDGDGTPAPALAPAPARATAPATVPSTTTSETLSRSEATDPPSKRHYDDFQLVVEKDGPSEKPKRLVNGNPIPPPDFSPIVLAFPVVGVDGPTWHLRQALLDHWQQLYPDLDVAAQARQMLAWLEQNPTKRKTAGGMGRALVAWFNRAVDQRRGGGPALITGSLKTAGNKAAIEEFIRRRYGVDE